MKLFLTAFIFLFSNASYAYNVCERTEQIKIFIEKIIGKHCDLITKEDLLNRVGGGAFLSDKGIESLKSIDFDGFDNFAVISLNRNRIDELPPNIFQKLTKLKSLSLDANYIVKLPDGVFRDLESLEELSLQRNALKVLEQGRFRGLKSLKKLNITLSGIESIEPHAFTDLSNLEILTLDYNRLETLAQNMFEGLHKLQELNIRNNQTTEIAPRAFDGLDSLQLLDMSHNAISLFPGIFSNIRDGALLLLTDNHFSEIPEDVFAPGNFGLTSRVCLAWNRNLSVDNKQKLKSFLGRRISFDFVCRF